MESSAKLASFDCRRHCSVLASAAYTPVPSEMTMAIAATRSQRRRRSRTDQTIQRRAGVRMLLPVQLGDGRLPPCGGRRRRCDRSRAR